MSGTDPPPAADSPILPPIHQALLDAPGDPDLLARGWEKRFVTDDARLEEARVLYQDVGFEVHTEPLQPPDDKTACADCALYANCHYTTIYVRRKKDKGES